MEFISLRNTGEITWTCFGYRIAETKAKMRLTAVFAEILNIEFIRRENYSAVAEALFYTFLFARDRYATGLKSF